MQDRINVLKSQGWECHSGHELMSDESWVYDPTDITTHPDHYNNSCHQFVIVHNSLDREIVIVDEVGRLYDETRTVISPNSHYWVIGYGETESNAWEKACQWFFYESGNAKQTELDAIIKDMWTYLSH